MVNKFLSTSNLAILPAIYLSGAASSTGPFFAIMSSNLKVGLLLIGLAGLAAAVSFRPRILSSPAAWLAVILLASIMLGSFLLSLASPAIAYQLTYVLGPLDLAIMAELGAAMLLTALLHQPSQKMLPALRLSWRNLWQSLHNWKIPVWPLRRHRLPS